MRRGEIWWASLPPPVGSGPGFDRPVLIVQANDFNASRIATVIVVVLTSNLRLADAPGNVLLPGSEVGLPKDSVANVSQVLTVDRHLLRSRAAVLPSRLMHHVEQGLRATLDL